MPVALVTSVAMLIAAALPWRQEPPASQESSAELPEPVAREVDFTADVEPIFERSCYSCHGPKRQRSDYRLDVKSSALGGGQIGGSILPGHSAQSPLIHYVAGVDKQIRMPAKGELLSPEEVGILRRWIDEGAPWPEAPEPEVSPAAESEAAARSTRTSPPDHWSYQPVRRPDLPAVQAAHWIQTPVDAFVLARLEEQGLHFAAPADPRTRLRRLYFDLTGLPPSPEEVDAFVADPAPDAWGQVVDRLLASPRYGERWARRWLDLVHFAETHGNDQDRPRPHAWPYRDWLIASFNADKPYARFVREQLAGDVLFPDDPQATVALGFIAAGPWDESSQLNIVDDTLDKQVARNLDRDDMVTTTMSTFVSSTVQCARCHNHKFDPIAQTEYYQLQSVFAGVDRADRPYDPDPELHRQRQSILKKKLAIERAAQDSAALNDPLVQQEVEEWERSLVGVGPPWILLDPEEVVSAGGATATRQPDGALLFSGERPEMDTYRVTVHLGSAHDGGSVASGLKAITALRLDLLPDETLPFKGPGRQDNGNLHLSELTVEVAPASDPAARVPVALAHASADFDQEGWTSAMAIDGKPETAWGIWPQVGRAHHAVFELAEPLDLVKQFSDAGGALLTVTLAQLHGGHHLIGKLRLTATEAPRPVRATTLPPAITKLLALAPEERTPAQLAELARHWLLQDIEMKLARLPAPELVYAGTTDFTPENNFLPARGPRPVRLLTRGEVARPGDVVAPSALSCVVGLGPELVVPDPEDEGARRAALAQWITDPRNSLTWRSIVNRVWQYHFGRGIVDTPSDFGVMGGTPSHPELLDWLAAWFLDHGGSIKALDRLLVTSAVYQQSTRFDGRAAAIDSGNALLWRMNRTRLDAESIRDAVLAVAGQLDLTMGGPSVKQFVESPGIHVTPNVDYDGFDVDRPESRRRSIYRFLFRTLPDPFMETMDCPDASQLAPTRSSSVTALQALSLLHNPFMVRMSEHVAERVAAAHPASASPLPGELGSQVDELFRVVLLRPPSPDERADFSCFIAKEGLAHAARLLLNSHEFVFVN